MKVKIVRLRERFLSILRMKKVEPVVKYKVRFGKCGAGQNLQGSLASIRGGRVAEAGDHQLRVHLLPDLAQLRLTEAKQQLEKHVEEKTELVGALFHLHVCNFPEQRHHRLDQLCPVLLHVLAKVVLQHLQQNEKKNLTPSQLQIQGVKHVVTLLSMKNVTLLQKSVQHL